MKHAFAAMAVAAGLGSPAFADDTVRVTGQDLAVQTHKWDGKTIETVLFCFYADLNEYRCAIPSGVRIDFRTLDPDSARAGIERNCDTLGKVLTAACRTRIRFVYEGFDSAPTNSGEAMAIVIAEDGKGTVVGR